MSSNFSYCHPHLEGWYFNGEIAFDIGEMYGKNAGIGFSIIKKGVF
jgi:hypothetical protein